MAIRSAGLVTKWVIPALRALSLKFFSVYAVKQQIIGGGAPYLAYVASTLEVVSRPFMFGML